MITKSDFFPDSEFPNGVSFYYPDHFVRLCNYRTNLLIENAKRSVELGESIPSSVMAERVMREFNLTREQLDEYSNIGNWVGYDRSIQAMSDDEKQKHYAEVEEEPSEELLAELAEAGFDLDKMVSDIVETSSMRNLETQMLNDLFNEE